MNFAETEEKEKNKKDETMSNELMKKLEAENAMLVISLKNVYHENYLAKREIEALKERETDVSTKLVVAERDRDNYKNLYSDTYGILKASRTRCVQLKQTNIRLATKSYRRAVTVVLLVLAFALAATFAIWSQTKASDYKRFSTEIKAAMTDSPLTADFLPDSVRDDYERLFGTTW